MRHSVTLALILLTIAGCEKENQIPDNGNGVFALTDGLCIQFSDSLVINHEQIDYYDLSTHMVYLRKPHDFLRNDNWDIGNGSFYVFADRDTVYHGTLWPAWSSAIPTGTYIDVPFWYPGYVIKIEHATAGWGVPEEMAGPDLRSDERIISALQRYGQYHEGLALSVHGIDAGQPGELAFSFTVTNRDSYNYHILSPDRMGAALFHYYTNGLTMSDDKGNWLQHRVEVDQPDPWDSWSMGWMELLKAGTKRTYTVHYPAYDPIPPGTYHVSFHFPGMRNVEQEQIKQGQGRIWLGGIYYSSEITVQ